MNAAAAVNARITDSQRTERAFQVRSPATAAPVALTIAIAMPTPRMSFHRQSI